MKKQHADKLLQRGWTTMEYVVGALIIVTIVASAIGLITEAINTKSQEVQEAIVN